MIGVIVIKPIIDGFMGASIFGWYVTMWIIKPTSTQNEHNKLVLNLKPKYYRYTEVQDLMFLGQHI